MAVKSTPRIFSWGIVKDFKLWSVGIMNLAKIAFPLLSVLFVGCLPAFGQIPAYAQTQVTVKQVTYAAPANKVFNTMVRSIAVHYYGMTVDREAGVIVFYTEDRTLRGAVGHKFVVTCDAEGEQTLVTLSMNSIDAMGPYKSENNAPYLWTDLVIYPTK
jgi:hypothetical protein